jgi:[acyl-carrier-protein] S-malonyltransferase
MIYLFPTFPMRAQEFDPGLLSGFTPLLQEFTARAACVVSLEADALNTFCADDRDGSEHLTIQAHYACIIESVAMARWMTTRLGPCNLVSAYSMGLFSAAAHCGAIEFERSLELARDICTAAHRAMGARLWAVGAIVGLPVARVVELLGQSAVDLEVTDRYDEVTTLFTGPRESVKQVLDSALEIGAVATRLIPVTAPFHTRGLVQIETQIADLLDDVTVRPPTCPILSSITQTQLVNAQDIRAEFCRNISRAMDWQATTQRFMLSNPKTIVEAGASYTLADMIRADYPAVCSVHDWRDFQGRAE